MINIVKKGILLDVFPYFLYKSYIWIIFMIVLLKKNSNKRKIDTDYNKLNKFVPYLTALSIRGSTNCVPMWKKRGI
jgi:hypothetical protein